MHESFQYDTHFRVFDSVEELIETAARLRLDPAYRLPLDRPEWIGRQFSTWDEVYQAARSAWPEGEEIVERMLRQLEDADLPKPKSRRRKPRFDEADGDEVDFDRLRTGRAFWRTTRRENLRGPQTVTILIDVNARSKIAHEDILWRGAAALAMTHILEQAGFRVELWIVHAAAEVYTDKTGHFHAVCLKRPSDPLDVATFVSAVSGWFYRSVMFRVKHRADRRLKRRNREAILGYPSPPSRWQVEHVLPGQADKAIVISGTYTESGAVWLAREALKKLAGVEPPKPVEPDPEAASAATPADPPKPLTPKERREQERRWKQWHKDWERVNVEQG